MSDPDNHLPPPPRNKRRCSECETVWFCTHPCPKATKHNFTSKPQPKPVHPGTATISPRTEWEEISTSPAAPAEAPARQERPPKVMRAEEANYRLGQRTWKEAVAILPAKVVKLQRTESLIDDIITDANMTLNLCPSSYHVQHARAVIASLPPSWRFKIGVTWSPEHRYYLSHYAYTKMYIQQKEHTKFEHMVILHVSRSREAIAMLEHALIVHFQSAEPKRCGNRKNDIDQKFRSDVNSESSEEEHEGPYTLYCVGGKRL